MSLRTLGPFSVSKPSFRKVWAVSQLSLPCRQAQPDPRHWPFLLCPRNLRPWLLPPLTAHPICILKGVVLPLSHSSEVTVARWTGGCGRGVVEGVEVPPPALRRGDGTEVPKGRTPRESTLEKDVLAWLHSCLKPGDTLLLEKFFFLPWF